MTAVTSLHQQLSTFYCFCSDQTYEEILAKQKKTPLGFHAFIETYTNCHQGCGSCIDNLRSCLKNTGYFKE